MPVPTQDRVVFRRNFIHEGLCQIRFKNQIMPLLNAEELPVDFHEKIRKTFPLLDVDKSVNITMDTSEGNDPRVSNQEFKIYRFSTIDKKWSVSLSSDFFALSTRFYSTREEFDSNLKVVFDAFKEVYGEQKFSRLGVRYQNIIERSHVGLKEFGWSDLINNSLLGVLSDDSFRKDQLLQVHGNFVSDLKDGAGKVQVNYGTIKNQATSEECYLIDSDFFLEGDLNGDAILDQVREFHDRAADLFLWCIRSPLREAMGSV